MVNELPFLAFYRARGFDRARDRAGRHRDAGRLDRARAGGARDRGSRRRRSAGDADGRGRSTRALIAAGLPPRVAATPALGPDRLLAVRLSAPRDRAHLEHRLRRRGAREPARRVRRSLALGHRPDAHPPARRSVSRRQQEPRGAAALLPARSPGLGLHQRELPAARAVPGSARRREEGARLGARARARVRRRSERRLRGRQLCGRSPGVDGRADRERSSLQPGFEERTPRHGRRLPVRLLRLGRARAVFTDGIRRAGRAAVLRRAPRSRHAGRRRRRAAVRRAPPQGSPARSSTRSCPARSRRSTSSTRSGSRR